MAEAFNPDKFLADVKEPMSQAGAKAAEPIKDFDPDKFLAEANRPWYSMTGAGMKQGFLNALPSGPSEPTSPPDGRPWYSMSQEGMKQAFKNALPSIGMLAGSALVPEAIGAGALLPAAGEMLSAAQAPAGLAGPVAKVGGAMAGAVAGESARSLTSKQTPTRGEYYDNLLNAGKSGGLAEVGDRVLAPVFGAMGGKLKRAASELSGVSEKEIENYASRADDINKLIKENQLDGKFDAQGAVNSMRENVLQDVRSEIAGLHDQIATSLSNSSAIPIFSVQPIRSALQKEMSKLDPIYQAGDIKAIESIISKIDKKAPEATALNIGGLPFTDKKINLNLSALKEGKLSLGGPVSKEGLLDEAAKVYPKSPLGEIPSWRDIGKKLKDTFSTVLSDANKVEPAAVDKAVDFSKVPGVPDTGVKLGLSKYHGYMNVSDAQATKNFLYNIAKGSYPNDEFFQVGPKVANAAKKAGRAAKEMLDRSGPPEIKAANAKLEKLHDIESSLSGNLLDTTKPPTKMLAVGSGGNYLDTKALDELGLLNSKNYLQDARDISTARTFANPKMFPVTTTGRSLYAPRVFGAAGTGLGAVVGGLPGAGIGGLVGTGMGGLVSSPWAIKNAIDVGQGLQNTVPLGLVGRGLLMRGVLNNLPQKSKASSNMAGGKDER